MTRFSAERHVVLVAPEVHWNTGNAGRTCLGAGARLHLIRPLGFSLESRQVKRAGLDYWDRVNLSVWEDYTEFYESLKPGPGEVAVFTKKAVRPFWEMPGGRRLFLIFGSETRGVPASIETRHPEACFHIPISSKIRCLNLSTSVGIALYESLRLSPPAHAWAPAGRDRPSSERDAPP